MCMFICKDVMYVICVFMLHYYYRVNYVLHIRSMRSLFRLPVVSSRAASFGHPATVHPYVHGMDIPHPRVDVRSLNECLCACVSYRIASHRIAKHIHPSSTLHIPLTTLLTTTHNVKKKILPHITPFLTTSQPYPPTRPPTPPHQPSKTRPHQGTPPVRWHSATSSYRRQLRREPGAGRR